MKSNQFISKIRNYSLISFLLPLITITLCLFLFKLLGDIGVYPNFSWNEKKIEYTTKEYYLINDAHELRSFINCPINKFKLFFQYKNKKIALKIINGLKIKIAGKYLAVLLIDTSPYKYGFFTFPKPDLLFFFAFMKIFSKF